MTAWSQVTPQLPVASLWKRWRSTRTANGRLTRRRYWRLPPNERPVFCSGRCRRFPALSSGDRPTRNPLPSGLVHRGVRRNRQFRQNNFIEDKLTRGGGGSKAGCEVWETRAKVHSIAIAHQRVPLGRILLTRRRWRKGDWTGATNTSPVKSCPTKRHGEITGVAEISLGPSPWRMYRELLSLACRYPGCSRPRSRSSSSLLFGCWHLPCLQDICNSGNARGVGRRFSWNGGVGIRSPKSACTAGCRSGREIHLGIPNPATGREADFRPWIRPRCYGLHFHGGDGEMSELQAGD